MATLTDLIRHFDPATRVERRRRIYAIADWWAAYLIQKHGDKAHALVACRRLQLGTSRVPAWLRNHIWCKVAERLK